jgi:hypothetical protein
MVKNQHVKMGDQYDCKAHATVKGLHVQNKIVTNKNTKQDHVRVKCDKTFG